MKLVKEKLKLKKFYIDKDIEFLLHIITIK